MDLKALDAVVLAGGVNKIPLFPGWQPGYKALLKFAGKPAIQYALEALARTPAVRRVLVAGPEAEIRAALAETGYQAHVCEYVPGGDSPLGSVRNALPHLQGNGDGRRAEPVLFVTADMPLITAASVQTFLHACAAVESPYPANLYLSAVPRSAFTGVWARSNKGHMTFRDGGIYHGNLALIDPDAFHAPGLVAILERLYHERKSPLGSSFSGGWKIALTYVFGAFLFRILSMEQMARIASKELGVGIVPVVVDLPEIAVDVDEADDYAFAQRVLDARRAATGTAPGAAATAVAAPAADAPANAVAPK